MEEKTVYTLSPNKEDFSDHQHSRIEWIFNWFLRSEFWFVEIARLCNWQKATLWCYEIAEFSEIAPCRPIST
jgi:hypothetical protein